MNQRRASVSEATPEAGTGRNHDDLLLVTERMVDELLHSMTAYAISNACGINYLTVSRIAKGESKRISGKVHQAIASFYKQHKAGIVARPRNRGERGKKTERPDHAALPAPSLEELPAAELFSVESLVVEIARLEKRLDVLRRMMDLARQL